MKPSPNNSFGVQPRELPLSPPRVWQISNAAEQQD